MPCWIDIYRIQQKLETGDAWTLPCAVRGMDLFDRYAAAMSLLHFLCVAIVEKLGGPDRARLQRIETLHEELHDFD